MNITYSPKGVCSRQMNIEIDNNIIKNIEIIGGCNGNLKGISSLVTGQDIDVIIEKLIGIKCGARGTSCPDQLAKALIKAKEEMTATV